MSRESSWKIHSYSASVWEMFSSYGNEINNNLWHSEESKKNSNEIYHRSYVIRFFKSVINNLIDADRWFSCAHKKIWVLDLKNNFFKSSNY